MHVRWLASPALALLLSVGSGALAEVAVPPLRAPVTDLTGTLTSEQIATLDRQLRAFEAKKGSQIALLIVPTTQPETIEQYAIRVAEAWKLGRQGVDDGAVLLIAKDDRAIRVEVGRGLEGVLPDVLANRIVEQVIVPRFRNNDFFGGIREAIERMIALVEGEPLPEPERARRGAPDGLGNALPLLLLLVFVGSGILRGMLGRFGGASVTAGIAAVIVWVLTSTVVIAIGAAVIAFVVGLLGGGGGGGWASPGRRGRGGYSGGWGGGLGGGGWGGGGGGGWSGGGGTFGGGGASGRW